MRRCGAVSDPPALLAVEVSVEVHDAALVDAVATVEDDVGGAEAALNAEDVVDKDTRDAKSAGVAEAVAHCIPR